MPRGEEAGKAVQSASEFGQAGRHEKPELGIGIVSPDFGAWARIAPFLRLFHQFCLESQISFLMNR